MAPPAKALGHTSSHRAMDVPLSYKFQLLTTMSVGSSELRRGCCGRELRESQVDWAGAGGPWRWDPLLDLHLRWWGPLRVFYRVMTGSGFHFQ